MKLILRGLGLLISGLIASITVFISYLAVATFLALPNSEGLIQVDGVSQPVTITRDERGVPWIDAKNAADAYIALGFVHAQDRLFQMEMMRRLGQGRLGEILGPLGVGSDKFMRTLGIYKLSQAGLQQLEPEARSMIEAYAKGVNAYINTQSLPLEFKLLFFKPEPWVAADSLVWQKLMGLQLSGNWPEELSRAALLAKLGPEPTKDLFPDVDTTSPITVASLSLDAITQLRAAMLSVVQPTLASNVWAVSGTRTATGAPFLANDPHLGFQSPNLWYLAGVAYPGVTLTGATSPGVPYHLFGHNGSLAWGITTTHGDTQDLFVETLVDNSNYQTPSGPAPFETREETINVRFGNPQTITVRSTRHGPVVSDVLPAATFAVAGQPQKVVALAATLLAPDDDSNNAIYHLVRSHTVVQFLQATRQFHSPQQNLMFADTQGSIGYIAAGRVPLRKSKDCDGLLPADGASGICDWTGWADFEALPQSINPSSGILINANNKIVPNDFPVLIAKEWPEGYRAQRIEDTLAGRTGLTIKDMDTVQHDRVSLMAREMLPVLLMRLNPADENSKTLKEKLAAWDGTMGKDQTEPLVFALWMERLKSRILADELGSEFDDFRGGRAGLLKKLITENAYWCDDISTSAIETCDMQVSAAWADAMSWLAKNAPTQASQRWGQWHIARFSHPIFGNIPGLSWLGGFAASTGGDDATVNRGSFAASTSRIPFRHRHGASFRAVYDLADLSRSQFSLAGGQSGNVLSAHFDDQLAGWANDESFPLLPPSGLGAGRTILTPPS